jgi:hypothetical protein
MTNEQARELTTGQRVYWDGDRDDCGIVTALLTHGVTVTWKNETSVEAYPNGRSLAFSDCTMLELAS